MTFFVKLLGEHPVRLKVEPGRVLRIGRSPEADLQIDDDHVSRLHCELEGTGGGVIVRDLESGNGTVLNGRRLSGEQAVARPGDQVHLGTAWLLIERQLGFEWDRRRPTAPMRPRFPKKGEIPELPGYDIIEKLGEGSTGVVFRASPEDGSADVALKVLKPLVSETVVKRIIRATEALERLEPHPNIVRVGGVWEADLPVGKQHFFTMELLEGTTLDKMLETDPLGPREAVAIGIQAARALARVHREGIIHRNVSPPHVMVLEGAVVKLLGFDFVKHLVHEEGGGTNLTGLDDIVGAISYNSPEQAGDPRHVDHRTDLYALGATLFHALTGRPPFEGKRIECFRKVLYEEPPRVSELVSDVPSNLEGIIGVLLEKKPDKRFGSGEEVERALAETLIGFFREGEKIGGGFSGCELLEVAQHLEHKQDDARIVVTAPPVAGELLVREGVVVGATAGTMVGEPVARTLLGLLEGTFEITEPAGGSPPAEGRLALRPSEIALEIMRTRANARRV